jgi:predicted nucleic acid-binding protein
VGSQRLIAVSDAGPLIHLAEIDSLSLLKVADQVHIPQAVWEEILDRGRLTRADLSSLPNVHSHTLLSGEVEQFVLENSLAELHAGERECLCLCRAVGATVLLTDDLAVREAAWRLNVQPVGSLGVIVRASLNKLISLDEAEQRIVQLYEASSLYVTRTIVELAIQQLSEHIRDS